MLAIRTDEQQMLHKRRLRTYLSEQITLQTMVLPGFILLCVFSYIPMWGILMSFQDYNIVKGFFGSRWVGLEQFRMFMTSRDFGLVMKNTIIISLLKFVVGFPAPIILALMLNEVRNNRLKKMIQTMTYLPYFLSWVIVSAMIFSLLSTENGSLNILLMKLGLIKEPVSWMMKRSFFLPLLIAANVWKDIGYSSIIYLAAIAGVNVELYEAAHMDGASRLRQAMHITLPGISAQIIILMILSVSSILNAGFDDIFLLTNSMKNGVLIPVANVIDTHVYQMGILTQRFSYATAVGLFKSLVNVGLLVGVNMISRKYTETSLW